MDGRDRMRTGDLWVTSLAAEQLEHSQHMQKEGSEEDVAGCTHFTHVRAPPGFWPLNIMPEIEPGRNRYQEIGRKSAGK
mgnify:CR=1 FL=1